MPHDNENLKRDGSSWDGREVDTVQAEGATLIELARGLNATVRLVQALHHEVKEFAIGQATLRLTINSMEETLRELRKAITASDPASLTIRVVVLEREIEAYKEWKKEQEAKAQHAELERSRAGWQIKVTAATAAIGLVSSIIMLILTTLVKH